MGLGEWVEKSYQITNSVFSGSCKVAVVKRTSVREALFMPIYGDHQAGYHQI
jgi:hypothetical protein